MSQTFATIFLTHFISLLENIFFEKSRGKCRLLDINIGVSQDKTTLVYTRKFHFGEKGNILFPAASYQPIKMLFDAFEKADSHIISLKQN